MITDLYDFEGNIEDAFASVLSSVPVEVSQGAIIHNAPCVSVMYVHGGDQDHSAPFPDGKWRRNAFAGVLQVDVVTNRKTPHPTITHRSLRSQVRSLLAPVQIDGREAISVLQDINKDYDIWYIKEAPSQQSVTENQSEDVTTLRFEIRFSFLFPKPVTP